VKYAYCRIILPFILLTLLWASTPAFAQLPDADAIQRSRQQFMQEELRQRQRMEEELRRRELEDAASRSPYNRPETPPADEALPGPGSTRCVEIREVVFEGNAVFSDSRIHGLIALYEGRCLRVEEINAMLGDITNAYLARGYTTSRAYMIMPQPRLQDGILEIRIVEGTIGSFEGIRPGERFTAFPFLESKVLNGPECPVLAMGHDPASMMFYSP
jgi:hemolysin activation/secretion protein